MVESDMKIHVKIQHTHTEHTHAYIHIHIHTHTYIHTHTLAKHIHALHKHTYSRSRACHAMYQERLMRAVDSSPIVDDALYFECVLELGIKIYSKVERGRARMRSRALVCEKKNAPLCGSFFGCMIEELRFSIFDFRVLFNFQE
jgi:hypothetical protein